MDDPKIVAWIGDFNNSLDVAVDQPVKEIFIPGLSFADWRISYGLKSSNDDGSIYFLSIYPAFCLTAKYTHHYTDLGVLGGDVLEIMEFTEGLEDKSISTDDIVAALFAIIRDKESIELFQDQKDFMSYGVEHYHLDNAYQKDVAILCNEYYEEKTLGGKEVSLSFLN
jgi:hypothetical protein